MFEQEHLQKMKEGVQLFNEQKYWECHEALEDVWMEDRNDPTRYIYWAIIQVAAACIHYRDGNFVGARGMIFKAKDKFKNCRERHVLSQLVFEYLDWQELEKLVMEIPEGDKCRLEHFQKLYEFRFKKYLKEEL